MGAMSIEGPPPKPTPLAGRLPPLDDRHGRRVIVVVMKMTYAVSPAGVSRPVLGAPVRLADERVSDEPNAGLRCPGDLVDEKPGADVILLGTAHPPRDRVVTEMEVSLRV